MELSLILCSRNDEYQGNSRWRLETTLNSLGEHVRAAGRARDVEVIVADWGSEIPLRDVIAIEPAASEIVSFLTIPPAVARPRQGDSPFPEVLALNAAARRARGSYIGRIDQDTMVGDRFFRWFFDPAGRAAGDPSATLWFANRRNVPYRIAARCPDRMHVERLIRIAGRALPVSRRNPWFGNAFWSSSVGIWLAHRARWEECGGYDERMIYYNWMETDMIRRLSRTFPMVDLGRLTGYDFYHLDHVDPRSLADRTRDHKNSAIDRDAPPPPLRANDAMWGLADCDLTLQPCARRPVPGRVRGGGSAVRDAVAVARLAMRLGAELAFGRLEIARLHGFAVAQRRTAAVRQGLAGRPVWFWPGTLWKLWHGRKMDRAR